MLNIWFDDEVDDYNIKGINRAKKVEKKRALMKVNARGLLTVTLPIIEKKGKRAKQDREDN